MPVEPPPPAGCPASAAAAAAPSAFSVECPACVKKFQKLPHKFGFGTHPPHKKSTSRVKQIAIENLTQEIGRETPSTKKKKRHGIWIGKTENSRSEKGVMQIQMDKKISTMSRVPPPRFLLPPRCCLLDLPGCPGWRRPLLTFNPV